MEESKKPKSREGKPITPRRMKQELDQNKEYEWSIVDITYRNINGRLMAIFDWSCKEAKVVVREFLTIPDEHKDSRIFKLMLTLGYEDMPDTIPDPRKFFERHMTITAKPLKYYAEFNSEVWKWKLNYETIRTLNRSTVSLPEDELNRLKSLALKQKNHQEAMQKVAAIRPDWMPAFLKLVEAGELAWSQNHT